MEPDAQKLCDELTSRRTQRFLGERKTFRQDHPRASSVGECAKEMVHEITDWQMRPAPDAQLLQRFRRGSEVERLVTRELLDDGWNIVEQQFPFEIVENGLIICTGHIDMRIEWNGSKPVVEVKSLNPNVWDGIESAHDFRRMGSFWAKYPRQLLLYMYHNAEELGLFLLDDCLGHIKPIPMLLDDWLDECEHALQTCKTAAVAARDGTLPPYCERLDVCQDCWCLKAGVCFPPRTPTDTPKIIDDPGLIHDLELLIGKEPEYKECVKIEKHLKATFKAMGEGTYIVGETHVAVTIKGKAQNTYVNWWPLPGAQENGERQP